MQEAFWSFLPDRISSKWKWSLWWICLNMIIASNETPPGACLGLQSSEGVPLHAPDPYHKGGRRSSYRRGCSILEAKPPKLSNGWEDKSPNPVRQLHHSKGQAEWMQHRIASPHQHLGEKTKPMEKMHSKCTKRAKRLTIFRILFHVIFSLNRYDLRYM